MGKRAGNLLSKIADPENIRIAFWKAAKGKRGKQEVQKFQHTFEETIKKISCEIASGGVKVGTHHFFTVFDPKKRQICAACFRERIIHHAIITICDPLFEKYQIFHSYACRKEKGSLKAVHRSMKFSRSYPYFLKLDIHKYYDSIDHDVLMQLLSRKLKDRDLLILFKRIINSYETCKGKGVPIGHLTSQYFGNFYLAFLDHFIKENLCVKGYVRYMDDMLLWSDSKKELKNNLKQIQFFLHDKLKLSLNPKLFLNRTYHGCDFLGYRIYPGKMCLSRKSVKRFRRKLRRYLYLYETGEVVESDLQNRLQALFDFTRKADSFGLRMDILEKSGTWSKARTA